MVPSDRYEQVQKEAKKACNKAFAFHNEGKQRKLSM
ncbi:Uncharacterized protein ANAPHAGO_00060 [Anaplasma phagocytophilum]|uniref:Uncharacterized protein n=1 Tax=Anaplasma phagocytophilum TaxID=948 RepID=A0A098GJA9_ANAPH|nr:Uncharacterized protein ANAPHAGO_00060 [Anaplasma phagocytophilum]